MLTAHPTEVRRKSTLTRELEIAGLLDERDRAQGDAEELALNEERLRRAVLILWRTNMLRQTRLKVIDEVANGLSYYDYTFFRELPRLYGAIEDELDALVEKRRGKPIPSFLQDRLVDRRRPRRQPLRHRRRPERGGAAAERPRARLLSRPVARARRRAVARPRRSWGSVRS